MAMLQETSSEETAQPLTLVVGAESAAIRKADPDALVWRVIKGVSVVGSLLLSLLVAYRAHDASPPDPDKTDTGSPIGWLGAVGAALLFGTVWVPYGLSSAESSDPNIRPWCIVAYGSLGTSLTTGAFSLVLANLHLAEFKVGTPEFICGAFGAVIVNAANFLAYLASRHAGVAVSPVLLASAAIVTSYSWGVLAFSEPMGDLEMSMGGLALLILGAATCTAAQTKAPVRAWDAAMQRGATRRAREREEARDRPSCSQRVFFVLGCLIALAAGTVDGSMLVPYKVFELRSLDSHGLQDQAAIAQEAVNQTHQLSKELRPVKRNIKKSIRGVSEDVSEAMAPMKPIRKEVKAAVKPVMKRVVKPAMRTLSTKPKHRNRSYDYLQGMAAAQLILSIVMISILRACDIFDKGGVIKRTREACWLPGLLGGMFWASGNIASIHGSEYLGVAVGFPLTQTNIAVAAFYGAALFGEMPHHAQRVACGLGICIQLLGSSCLAVFA